MEKHLFYFILFSFILNVSEAQNIDYESRITSFYGSNCGNDPGFSTTEEHTWHGYLSDNVNTAETYSGCVQRNNNGGVTQTGTYAIRNRYNVTSTQIRTRINAYEDDMGSRCSYDTGFNSDDCRANQTCTYNFSNPLEYQWTSATQTCGSGDYNMNTFYQYRYATTTIAAAVDNSTFGYTTGGNRAFWGSLGAWAIVGSDCAASGTITHNQTSSFSTTVSCLDQVSFRWNVSSEASWDFLIFYINGVEQARISGTPGWATRTFNLDPNIDNVLEWRYTKDGSVSSNLDRGFVDQIIYSNYTIPTAGLNFGTNTWNVSCYNGRNLNLSGVTYRGYYVDNNLNINTQNIWPTGGTPSSAVNYDGCSVNTDNHTFVHKRQGFTCGIYNINVTGHDDEVRLYVNGAQVWNFAGCCTNHGTVWTGFLTASTTVEVRVAEGGGGSNLAMNLVNVTPSLSPGAVSGAQTICPGGNPSILNSTTAASGGTLAYTTINYQWQFSNNNNTWSNIGGATGASYDPPAGLAQIRYYRRRVIDACGTTGYSNTITVSMQVAPAAGLNFGSNIWNVSVYEGRNINLTGIDYRGYYTESNLNFDTQNRWASVGAPSSASGYNGCPVGIDNHTFVHKREGFTCGDYRIDLPSHDDEIRIYVNGIQVFEHLGCCDSHTGVWSGFLNSTSTVEIRTGEIAGGSYTSANFINITPAINGGTIGNNQSVCTGNAPTSLTSINDATGPGTITYQWQVSLNNSTWSNISGANSNTYSPPSISQNTYYRRRSVDQCLNTNYSNTVTATVNPLPNGNLTAVADICAPLTGAIVFTSTAGTGPFDIVYNGNTLNNANSGVNITVTPPSTTTYTLSSITDDNGCVRTTGLGSSATINVNGSSVPPSASVVLASSNSSSTCFVSGTGFRYFYNSAGELLAAINPNGQNLGNVTISINVNDFSTNGQGLSPGVCGYTGVTDGEYALPRNWDIDITGTNPTASDVDVIFYYNDSELTALTNQISGLSYSADYISCWGNVTSEADLMMTVEHSSSEEIIATADLSFGAGPATGQRSVGFVLGEFSSGKLHSNGGSSPGNALPVEMISFTAESIENKAIQLDWITATEINNDGFEVQRSTDGTRFERIGWIAGNGNTNKRNVYSIIDNKVEAGVMYYYRLNQIDYDGAYEYSNIVNASLKGNNDVVVSYFIPNPSTEVSAIVFEVNEETEVQIEILDNLGRLISSSEKTLNAGKETVSFDLKKFATGVYTAKILMNNEEFTRKLVVRK